MQNALKQSASECVLTSSSMSDCSFDYSGPSLGETEKLTTCILYKQVVCLVTTVNNTLVTMVTKHELVLSVARCYVTSHSRQNLTPHQLLQTSQPNFKTKFHKFHNQPKYIFFNLMKHHEKSEENMNVSESTGKIIHALKLYFEEEGFDSCALTP